MLSLIVIGNIIIIIGNILDLTWLYFFNEKKRILRENIVSSSLSFIADAFFKAPGAMITAATTIIRLIVIYLKDKYNKKFTILFILISIMYLSALSDWRGIPTILLVCSQFSSFIPKWFSRDAQHLRWGGLGSNILLIPYNYIIHNYTGITFGVINIVIISISIVKWAFRNKPVDKDKI